MAEETITYTRRVKQRITASHCDKLLMCHYTRTGDASGGKCSQLRVNDTPGLPRSNSKASPTDAPAPTEDEGHILRRLAGADEKKLSNLLDENVSPPGDGIRKSSAKRSAGSRKAQASPDASAYETPTGGPWTGRGRAGSMCLDHRGAINTNDGAEADQAATDGGPRGSWGGLHGSQEDASITAMDGFDFDSTPHVFLSPGGPVSSSSGAGNSIGVSPLVSASLYFKEVDAEQLEEETPGKGKGAGGNEGEPSPGFELVRRVVDAASSQPGPVADGVTPGPGAEETPGRHARPRSWRSPNVCAMYPTLTLEYDKYRETLATMLPADLQLSPVPLADFCHNISISKLGSPVIYPGLLD